MLFTVIIKDSRIESLEFHSCNRERNCSQNNCHYYELGRSHSNGFQVQMATVVARFCHHYLENLRIFLYDLDSSAFGSGFIFPQLVFWIELPFVKMFSLIHSSPLPILWIQPPFFIRSSRCFCNAGWKFFLVFCNLFGLVSSHVL